MKLKKIICISRVTLPRRNAHTIQIIKTCASFADQGIEVILYVKKNEFKDNEDVFGYFGLQANGTVQIKTFPSLFRRWKRGAAIFASLRFMFENKGAVFYVRGYKVSNEMIRLRWLHGLPVFVELHSLSESANRVHMHADGIVFAWKAAKTSFDNSNVNTPTTHAWFATEPVEGHEYTFLKRTGIYYVGNFYKYHHMDVLFETMKHVNGEKLILVGGNNKEDVSRTMDDVRNLGVTEKVVFNGYAEPKEIKNILSAARLAVMTYFGIKLNDYLSSGLPIVAPDHPRVKEVLQDGKDCVMYQQGNPESFASAINKVLENPTLAETLARNAYETAIKYSIEKRAEKIVDFIEVRIQ